MKIAKGDFAWPDQETALAPPLARDVANKLLVRDPSHRAKVEDVWQMIWVAKGTGSLTRRRSQMRRNPDGTRSRSISRERSVDGLPNTSPHRFVSPSTRLPERFHDAEEADDDDDLDDDEDRVWVKTEGRPDDLLQAEVEPL